MDEQDKAEYELLMELEQLETLKEEMEELHVSNLAEVEARTKELNRKLEALQQPGGDPGRGGA